jgi:phage terminase Nu1 subunit (DNA packaging protein)
MGRPRKIKASHLRELAGISKSSVSENPHLARTADGSIDAEASIAALETLEAAQARKEMALANTRELEYAEKIGELVPVAEMEQAWANVAQVFRDSLLSLPEKIAPQLAALTDARQVRDLLKTNFGYILANIPDRVNANRQTS